MEPAEAPPKISRASSVPPLCTKAELVAFADQDDIWQPHKLARHAAILETGVDGVSSSVMSFTAAGARSLIKKDYPQRQFDYLLESPGPGCSFLITPRLLALTAHVLDTSEDARAVDFHDSLIYAVARGHGWRWHIDGYPSVDYRQHESNVMGANVGLGAARERLRAHPGALAAAAQHPSDPHRPRCRPRRGPARTGAHPRAAHRPGHT